MSISYLALTLQVVVGINRFGTDSEEELQAVKEAALAAGAFDAVVCSHWAEGGKGAVSERASVVPRLSHPEVAVMSNWCCHA